MMADDPATSARLLSLPGARGPASSAQSACPFFERIAVKRFSHEEAKGPTWARAQDTDMLKVGREEESAARASRAAAAAAAAAASARAPLLAESARGPRRG